MRRYGLYDATRGLATALSAGLAGVLLWLGTLVGVQTVTHFWESMGIVAAAGLVVALSQVIGGWTKGHGVRLSPGTFLLAFVPVLICVGWILMATQPGNGWHEGTITSWSRSIGILGLVHSLGLWHGVLAFGFGLMLGFTLDTVPTPVEPLAQPVPTARARTRPAEDLDDTAANEPMTAERQRQAAYSRRPPMAAVGPRRDRTRDVEDAADVDE
jgi:hypothetical protein